MKVYGKNYLYFPSNFNENHLNFFLDNYKNLNNITKFVVENFKDRWISTEEIEKEINDRDFTIVQPDKNVGLDQIRYNLVFGLLNRNCFELSKVNWLSNLFKKRVKYLIEPSFSQILYSQSVSDLLKANLILDLLRLGETFEKIEMNNAAWKSKFEEEKKSKNVNPL